MQVIEAIGGLHVVTPYVDHRQVPLSLTIIITFIVTKFNYSIIVVSTSKTYQVLI